MATHKFNYASSTLTYCGLSASGLYVNHLSPFKGATLLLVSISIAFNVVYIYAPILLSTLSEKALYSLSLRNSYLYSDHVLSFITLELSL